MTPSSIKSFCIVDKLTWG